MLDAQLIKNMKIKTIKLPEFNHVTIKQLRKTKRLTLRQVETGTGISNAYLSQLENGVIKNPSYTVVKTLLDFYMD